MPHKILQHVEAITRHRDSILLDQAVVGALLGLIGVGSIRVHHPTNYRQHRWLTTTAWSEGDQPHCMEEGGEQHRRMPFDRHSPAARAIDTGQMVAEPPTAAGRHRYWMPVMINQDAIACLEMEFSRPFTTRQQGVVQGILGLYRNYLGLLLDSQHDTLTGLSNRKTFDSSLDRFLTIEKGDSKQLSGKMEADRRTRMTRDNWLAVIDVDHFKNVNDRFGHLYGDEVLILLANLMRESFRQQDHLFRFGGEEFVVLLRGVGIRGARNTLERFRKTVETHAFPQVDQVTVSIGFTRAKRGDSPTTVLGQADEALYYAKQHGRNQIQYYEQLIKQGHLLPKEIHTDTVIF